VEVVTLVTNESVGCILCFTVGDVSGIAMVSVCKKVAGTSCAGFI
jgi:hypothetical protein